MNFLETVTNFQQVTLDLVKKKKAQSRTIHKINGLNNDYIDVKSPFYRHHKENKHCECPYHKLKRNKASVHIEKAKKKEGRKIILDEHKKKFARFHDENQQKKTFFFPAVERKTYAAPEEKKIELSFRKTAKQSAFSQKIKQNLDHINFHFEEILKNRFQNLPDLKKINLLFRFIELETSNNSKYIQNSTPYIFNYLRYLVKKTGFDELREREKSEQIFQKASIIMNCSLNKASQIIEDVRKAIQDMDNHLILEAKIKRMEGKQQRNETKGQEFDQKESSIHHISDKKSDLEQSNNSQVENKQKDDEVVVLQKKARKKIKISINDYLSVNNQGDVGQRGKIEIENEEKQKQNASKSIKMINKKGQRSKKYIINNFELRDSFTLSQEKQNAFELFEKKIKKGNKQRTLHSFSDHRDEDKQLEHEYKISVNQNEGKESEIKSKTRGKNSIKKDSNFFERSRRYFDVQNMAKQANSKDKNDEVVIQRQSRKVESSEENDSSKGEKCSSYKKNRVKKGKRAKNIEKVNFNKYFQHSDVSKIKQILYSSSRMNHEVKSNLLFRILQKKLSQNSKNEYFTQFIEDYSSILSEEQIQLLKENFQSWKYNKMVGNLIKKMDQCIAELNQIKVIEEFEDPGPDFGSKKEAKKVEYIELQFGKDSTNLCERWKSLIDKQNSYPQIKSQERNDLDQIELEGMELLEIFPNEPQTQKIDDLPKIGEKYPSKSEHSGMKFVIKSQKHKKVLQFMKQKHPKLFSQVKTEISSTLSKGFDSQN